MSKLAGGLHLAQFMAFYQFGLIEVFFSMASFKKKLYLGLLDWIKKRIQGIVFEDIISKIGF